MAKTTVVSWSEIDTFRQCPFKHNLAYRERWSKPPEEGSALARGSLFHLVMENHFNILKRSESGESVAVLGDAIAFNRVLLGTTDDDEQTEQQNLVGWMYDGYVERYGLDDEWEILEVEHADEFWLPTERGTRSSFKIKMKIDLIVRQRSTGRVWIVDHKSGKDLPNDKMLELNDQFGLYVWGMRQRGYDIAGAIHNFVRTQRNKGPMELDTRFKRTMLYRTDEELDTIAVEAYKTMRRAYAIKPGGGERATNEDTCRWRCNFTEDCLGSRKMKPVDQRPQLIRSLELHGFVQNFERH